MKPSRREGTTWAIRSVGDISDQQAESALRRTDPPHGLELLGPAANALGALDQRRFEEMIE